MVCEAILGPLCCALQPLQALQGLAAGGEPRGILFLPFVSSTTQIQSVYDDGDFSVMAVSVGHGVHGKPE